jgi:hypothetical protein
MRAFEREKADARQQRQAEAVERWSAIWRTLEMLEADQKPARSDVELLITGFRRFRAARGDLSLEAAFGLIGGRGIHDALRLADRDEILRDAWRRCLPELTASAAARRLLEAENLLMEAARRGSSSSHITGELGDLAQRALIVGGRALPEFKQLTRILIEGRMPPIANVPGAQVPAARGRRKTAGEKVDASSGGSIRRGRDREFRSRVDGGGGETPAASVMLGQIPDLGDPPAERAQLREVPKRRAS